MSYDIFTDLPRIAAALLHEPWLIEPGRHRSMVEQLHAARSQPMVLQPVAADGGQDRRGRRVHQYAWYDEASRIGVLEIKGIIGKGLSNFAMDCGGLCLDVVEEGLSWLADRHPAAVQLYLNTPGGTATGVEEFAASLRDFSTNVAPTHAYVDSQCASAGEWIVTGATTRHASGSATLGSIGVYTALFDQSSRYAQAGVQVHLVNTGPLKGAGYPGTRITEAQIADAQRQVDAIAADFFAAMSARWPALKAETHFTGGTFMAKSAEGMALHDGIYPSRTAHLTALLAQYAGAPRR